MLAPRPGGVGALSSGKSWIRHCFLRVQKYSVNVLNLVDLQYTLYVFYVCSL